MVILEILLFLENPLVLLQHHFRSVHDTFLGLFATLLQGCVQPNFWSVRNSILGVRATLFLECVRSACNTILELHATPF